MVFVKKTVLLFQHLFFTLLPNVGMWPIMLYFATHCEQYDQSCFTLLPNVGVWPIMFFCYLMWACDQLSFFFLLPNAGIWPIMFYFFVFPRFFFFFFFHVRTFLEWPNLVHKLISKGEINISETGLHSLLVALG